MNEEQLSKFHELYFAIIAKQVANLSEKQCLRNTDSFLCSICFQPFSNKKSDDHCPMILIECGHTFCLMCIKNFKEDFSTRYKCPLDKAMSYHTVANFHLLSQISNAPKQEFRPTCEQHQGRDILFYKPNLQKFYCQQCLDEDNINNSSLSVIDGLLFIAYESQKPKLQEWIKHKVQTNLQEELGECKFLEKSQIKQSQDKLVNEYKSSKMEVIKKITAEFDAMIAKIETNFSDDVYQEAIKIKRELAHLRFDRKVAFSQISRI
ncbi:hypothetical protein FGO68_gene13038 [Halteria grandinella]|uniref:RING-type domain-containing protein n=1 Tax=Halteria grandinella TaxID=5974 RepID=A0A8J8NTN1_HALGN|nr:hypothetical protein FGO68_gene13038 [Halteria grandinella]